MALLCGNCDAHPAVWRCLQCDKDVADLCEECVALHSKTKAFREHSVVSLQAKRAETCRNCEETVSKFVCSTCGDSDKYLCLGCSLLHPKIKQFRGHSVLPLDEGDSGALRSHRAGSSSHTQPPFLVRARLFFEQQVDVILNRPWGSAQWVASVCIVLATFLAYYVAIKVFCGQFASAVHLVTMIGLVRMAQPDLFATSNKKHSRTDSTNLQSAPFPPSSSSSTTTTTSSSSSSSFLPDSLHRLRRNGPDDLAFMAKEFPNEFKYEGAGRPAALRPRNRPYQQRKQATHGTLHSSRRVLPESDDTLLEVDPN